MKYDFFTGVWCGVLWCRCLVVCRRVVWCGVVWCVCCVCGGCGNVFIHGL